MTTARVIIRSALTFHLNRLSPGEVEDADLFGACLNALNDIADEWNNARAFLFREILTASTTISSASAALGTAWASLSPGDEILGASFVSNGQDIPMSMLTMQQYHELVPDKAQTGDPQFFAPDGLALVYFTPVPTGHTIKLRTRQTLSDFADLDTDYSMPKGYKSALSACLAERLAPSMLGGLPPAVALAARAARARIGASNAVPAVLGSTPRRGNIFSGV